MPRVQVCVLTERDIRIWEKYKDLPDCEHHKHLSFKEANRLLEAPESVCTAREVQHPIPTRYAIAIEPFKVWKGVNGVMQLVKGVVQGRKSAGCSRPKFAV